MLYTNNYESIVSLRVGMILSTPFILGMIFYVGAISISNRRGRSWPLNRTGFWISGSTMCLAAVSGPLAELSHVNFRVHMVGHLLLGMLGPLLMVLGAPVTLMLRALSINQARRLTKIFRSRVVGLLSHPLLTATLNIGSLWVLYTTSLFQLMHKHIALHIFIHLLIFIAGYLFTVSIIYIDPIPHRRSYLSRSIILVLALAAHGILSKYIYHSPPEGVAQSEAEVGGMIMYYGGDAVDIIIIIILCYHWYKAATPRETSRHAPAST